MADKSRELTDQELAIKSGQDSAKENLRTEKLQNDALTDNASVWAPDTTKATDTTETPNKTVGNKK